MLKVTEKGKALIAKNGGILKIQALESSGNFDYSEYNSWADVYEAWAAEVGGWGYYEGMPKDSNDDEVFSSEEAKERLDEDFRKATFETTIDEIIANNDMYGVGVQFGYVEDVDDE